MKGKLIENGIIQNKYKYVDNEQNKRDVENYMRDFMGLIHGAEDVYIENSYDYDKNKDYYDENNIRSNKDIFLINRKNDENYRSCRFFFLSLWIHDSISIHFFSTSSFR